MKKKIDRSVFKSGKRVNHWTVIEDMELDDYMALCRCDCGTKRKISIYRLNNKTSKICGCIKKYHTKVTHGFSGMPEFTKWNSMMSRCYNREHKQYHRYGGRGIKVCDRWHTFINYLDDIGLHPHKIHLDRIDNNGDYTKDNVRFVPAIVNNHNTNWREHQEVKNV